MKHSRSALLLVSLVAASCAGGPGSSGSFGDYRRPVTVASDDAREHFERGLILAYGFNHDEAAREFERATEIAPDFGMAWWGIAYALSPNINLPLEDAEVALRGHRAAQQAMRLRGSATPVERALIEAMATRFSDPVMEDRKPLDEAYAAAMRKVWERFPRDPDVGVLFADAMLNLRPWDQWQTDGTPQPGTLELVAALDDVLALAPAHPGANHLYIHAIEASKNPERAEAAADRLRLLNITAVGHLVHMPSHIYIRVGRYADAMEANRLAVEADREYFRRAGPQGIYEFYKAHNHHFESYSAMFLGNREVAVRAAREGAAEITPSVREAMAPFADCYLAVPLHALIRFGLWEEVLAEAEFGSQFPISVATRHYARGVALANLDRFDEAEAEAAKFAVAAAAIPEEARIVGTPAAPVMEVARHMLAGELEFQRGNHDAGLASLRKAIELEDALPYDEPRGWMQPVRHALGGLLLELGRADEAASVYRADLAIHPNNGWSLHGLSEAQKMLGEVAAAEATRARFELAWAHADVSIDASCFCAQLAGPGACR